MGKSDGTLHTLPKPPPSVDGGKKRELAVMANHCQLQSNEMSHINKEAKVA